MKKFLSRLSWFYIGGVVATLSYTLTTVWSATSLVETVAASLLSLMLSLCWPVYLAFAWLQHYGVV